MKLKCTTSVKNLNTIAFHVFAEVYYNEIFHKLFVMIKKYIKCFRKLENALN